MGGLQLGKLSLALAIAMFAAAALYISSLIAERQNALTHVSRYNLAWSASQAVTELGRLEFHLASFAMPQGGVAEDEVALRYDILVNRSKLLDGGEVRAFAERDPSLVQTIVELKQAIADVQPLIDRLDAPGVAQKAIERLSPLDAKLVRFAAAANRYGGEQVSNDQSQLIHLHHLFSVLTTLLVGTGVVLVVLMIGQNRLLRRAHGEVRALAVNLGEAKDEADRAREEAEAAREAAQRADRAKSDFLANMSHELRTPLNAIIGYSEMLLEDAAADGRTQDTADLSRIMRAGRHLLSLVNDVLDLSKIEAGKMELDRTSFVLDSFIEDVVATAEPLAEKNSNQLVIERSAGLGNVLNDETKLRQVVLNLLSNAAKFTRNGKIIVTVASDEAAGMLSIAVRDTGMGISPDNLARLFQNFAQADATISKNFGGTGLGLALSRKLARLMGGDIDVTSDLGKGSTFTLRVSLNADMGTHDEEENDAALEQPAADPAAEPSPKALAFAS